MAGIISGVNQANSNLNKIGTSLHKTSQILSTGSNFPSASYNPAAYSIFQRMNSQIAATSQSVQNTQNASAMIKVAAGATSNTVSALESIREELIKAANGTNSDSDRAAIQQNINQLVKQIDDNSRVEYNGKNLLDDSQENIMIAGISGYENATLGNMSAQALGLMDEEGNVTINVFDSSSIEGAMEVVNRALDEATTQGAQLQGLEAQIDNYTTGEENTQAAASNSGDADMAKHSIAFKLQKIQQQVAIEISKLYNHSQAGVLRLLQ